MHAVVALDRAVDHPAARDRPEAADAEGLHHQGPARGDLDPLGLQQSFQRQFDVIGQLVNEDRKSTRLNSSHVKISYAVFCLKKKKKYNEPTRLAAPSAALM